MSGRRFLSVVAFALLTNVACATDEAVVILPVGSEIVLSLDQELSTKTLKPGDWFDLHTAEAVVVDGATVIPVGATARGQVIHAQKAGAFGRAAELLLTVRHIEVDGQQVPTRQVTPMNGKDRVQTSANVSAAVGLFGAFVRGGQIILPAGLRVLTLTTAEASFAVPPSRSLENADKPLPEETPR